MYMVSNVIEKLEEKKYNLTYSDDTKKIYNNGTNKIIIKDDFNYLIILIMEA